MFPSASLLIFLYLLSVKRNDTLLNYRIQTEESSVVGGFFSSSTRRASALLIKFVCMYVIFLHDPLPYVSSSGYNNHLWLSDKDQNLYSVFKMGSACKLGKVAGVMPLFQKKCLGKTAGLHTCKLEFVMDVLSETTVKNRLLVGKELTFLSWGEV